jgi:RimJ/RimL family protein N-acetyltransferase
MRARPLAIRLVAWQDLAPIQRNAVRELRITPQQTEYAGPVERSVSECEQDTNESVVGLAVLSKKTVLGFFVLKRASKAPAWSKPEWATLSAMRIDASLQGQGIGPAALVAVRQWIALHWPQSEELALSVDEENTQGIQAYLKAGFRDHGRREPGRIGWVRYMSVRCGERA